MNNFVVYSFLVVVINYTSGPNPGFFILVSLTGLACLSTYSMCFEMIAENAFPYSEVIASSILTGLIYLVRLIFKIIKDQTMNFDSKESVNPNDKAAISFGYVFF